MELWSWRWSREKLHHVAMLWWKKVGNGSGSGFVDSLDIEPLVE